MLGLGICVGHRRAELVAVERGGGGDVGHGDGDMVEAADHDAGHTTARKTVQTGFLPQAIGDGRPDRPADRLAHHLGVAAPRPRDRIERAENGTADGLLERSPVARPASAGR